MILVLLSFLLTTAGYGFLVWLAVRRVVEHLRECPEGVAALSEHLLLPVFGKRKPEEVPEPEPEKPEPQSLEESIARENEKGVKK